MVEMDTMDMDGENTDVPLDEDTGIEPFLTFLPPYILCNTTNYTKLPLCNNDTKLVEVGGPLLPCRWLCPLVC